MEKGRDILVLRDERGIPFLLPQQVVEKEELVALRVGEDEYLVPRKELLESALTDPQAPADGAALSVRTSRGTEFRLAAETLERARVASAEEHAAAGQVLDPGAAGPAALTFDIERVGPGTLKGGRGMELGTGQDYLTEVS
jgi:hypothetical protein